MYLAGILALWALLHSPVWGGASSVRSPLAIADAHSIQQASSAQEPAKPEPPAEPARAQEQPAQQQEQPKTSAPEKPQETGQPQSPTPQQEGTPASATPEKKPQSNPAGHRKRTKKKPAAPVAGEEQKKKVISHGSADEPITVLAPGMTDEQAARQRAVTDQLLASTDASLQRLSTRNLNKDQQDTVAQIRKFMEQVKTAQAAGDLQRAYKLAVKAHLLADALEKS